MAWALLAVVALFFVGSIAAWAIAAVALAVQKTTEIGSSGAKSILKPLADRLSAWSPERAKACLSLPWSLNTDDPFESPRREIEQLRHICAQANAQIKILKSARVPHTAIEYETDTWRQTQLEPAPRAEWVRDDLMNILGGECPTIGQKGWDFVSTPMLYPGKQLAVDKWTASDVTLWELLTETPKPILTLPSVAPWRQRFVESAYRPQIEEYKKAQAKWAKLNNERLLLSSSYSRILKELKEIRVTHEQTAATYSARALQAFVAAKHAYEKANDAESKELQSIIGAYMRGSADKNSVVSYFRFVMTPKIIHPAIPPTSTIEYEADTKTLLLECQLPDLRHVIFKRPRARGDGFAQITGAEQRELKGQLHPAIILRFATEILREDLRQLLERVAVNGFVRFRDPGSGQFKNAYAATMLADARALRAIELTFVNPVDALRGLGGATAGESYAITPITPVLRFNEIDERFIEGRDVLASTEGMNLATMPWDIFEHLVRELFELEYARAGAKVEITRASRDRGVDAVVFDPDPMRGGKFIVQAKRYVNTVDVASVRDLYGTLISEGAARGILVTTSQYGRDSYEFIANKPITLIDGAKLLGLLEKHGRKFKIDLEEARRLSGELYGTTI